MTDPVGGGGCTRSESLKLSHQSRDRRSHCRGRVGGDMLGGECFIPPSCLITHDIATGGARGSVVYLNIPVLGGLQPHVAAMLRVETGEEQVGVGPGRRRGRVLVCPGAGAARVGLKRGAETHPHRVGGPVGPRDSSAGRRREAASSDQNQLVPSTLPPHGLRSVETATKEAV